MKATLLTMSLLLVPAACIPSNVVARQDRAVATAVDDLQFAAAQGLAPRGLYESVAVTGDAALSLRKVYYLFAADGRYSAAALVEDAGVSAFQTLSGTWRMTAEGLQLDDGDVLQVEVSGDHLRLSAAGGVLVLRAGELQ